MIDSIRQVLAEKGQDHCIQNDLHYQEKRRGVNLKPKRGGKAIKIKVDGCLINDPRIKKCDCLYFYEHSSIQRHVFLVELKGTHYLDALAQLSETCRHQNFTRLITVAKTTRKPFAVAIVGEKARTDTPDKEEWEDENNCRLRVINSDDDSAFDLSTLVKSN